MRWLAALAWVGLLTGCHAPKPDDFTEEKALYDHAMKLFQEKEHSDSVPFFESLRNRFPQSPYAADAELKLGDAHFELGEYAESEVSYQTFRSLHPTHSKVPYAVFRIGMCNYKRIPGGKGRDLTMAEKAVNTWQELLDRWPDAPEATQAKPLIVKCRRAQARYEIYVADFYFKQDEYRAALGRLAPLTERTEFKDIQAEASYKLGLAYYELKDGDKARTALTKVVDNPEAGKYREKAQRLLAKTKSM